MRRLNPLCVLWIVVAILSITTACDAKKNVEQIRWRIELTSSGGFSGEGSGSVVAKSDGTVTVERPARTCHTQLTEANLRGLQQAVGAVAPGRWQTGYLPGDEQVCCDRLYWRLDVELEGTDGTVRHAQADWHEAAFNQLPEDLAVLARLALRLRDFTEEGCEART